MARQACPRVSRGGAELSFRARSARSGCNKMRRRQVERLVPKALTRRSRAEDKRVEDDPLHLNQKIQKRRARNGPV